MQSRDWQRIQDIFQEGLELSESGRERLLVTELVDRLDLQDEVRELWRNSGPEPRLEGLPARAMRAFLDHVRPFPQPPRQIGPYKICKCLGEGGMGVVYLAERELPFRRSVALKVLTAGRFSPELLARFRREQETLAQLNHPNIVVVHDADVTVDGFPFFAMEYVEGCDITRYADEHGLDVDRRLALFRQLCEGVRHAHQKGVIHRDLKPGNILVAEKDGKPLVKIIDFGIAALLAETEEQAALFRTKAGTILGTPNYTAPEIFLGGETRDTRCDCYSLGVVLCELLTGTTPMADLFDRFDSWPDLIRKLEVGLPKPPHLLIKGAKQADEMARKRQTRPEKLTRLLLAEPGWIVAKAAAKSPRERYGSVEQLLEDLDLYQSGQPILAAPQRTWYFLKKAYQRTRKLVWSAAFAALAVLIGLLVSLYALNRVSAAKKETEQLDRWFFSVFESTDPFVLGPQTPVAKVFERAAEKLEREYPDNPNLRLRAHFRLGSIYESIGLDDEAVGHFNEAAALMKKESVKDRDLQLRLRQAMAFSAFKSGRFEEAVSMYQEILEPAERAFGHQSALVLSIRSGYATALSAAGRADEAEPIFRDVLEKQTRVLGPVHSQSLATVSNYSSFLIDQFRFDEAKRLLMQTLDQVDGSYAPHYPLRLNLLHNMGSALQGLGEFGSAASYFREAHGKRAMILGAAHPETIMSRVMTATAIGESGKPGDAVNMLKALLADLTGTSALPTVGDLRATHGPILLLLNNLGHFSNLDGHPDQGEPYLRLCLDLAREKRLDPDQRDLLLTRATLGESLLLQKKYDEAALMLTEVVARSEKVFGADSGLTQAVKKLLQTAEAHDREGQGVNSPEKTPKRPKSDPR